MLNVSVCIRNLTRSPRSLVRFLIRQLSQSLRFSFPVPVVGPRSLVGFCRRKHKKSTTALVKKFFNNLCVLKYHMPALSMKYSLYLFCTIIYCINHVIYLCGN